MFKKQLYLKNSYIQKARMLYLIAISGIAMSEVYKVPLKANIKFII